MQAIPPSQAEIEINDRELRKGSSPVWRILQGIFVIAIGIFLIVLNLGNPYKEITGKILSITAQPNASGSYGASYMQVSTDLHNLYIFDITALHPAWTGQFSTNARVDVYYNSGDTPKRIVALQMYDLTSHPTTKYTTTEYTNSLSASPLSNIGLDVGLILMLLGALWAARGVFLLVRTRRR